MGLLAEPDRLRVVSALALGATTLAAVSAATGLDLPQVVAAVRRLERGGLVEREKDQLTLRAERFREAAREAAPAGPVEPLSADPATDAVLRSFTREGRIIGFPASRTKRRLLLEHVAAVFEPGVRYPEREVNAMMRAWYDDYAMLRRYLVNAALLDRADNVYWRIGGPVDLDPAPDPAGPEAGAPVGGPEEPEGGTPTPAGVPSGAFVGVPTDRVADPGKPPRQIQRVAAYGLARAGGTVLLSHLRRGDARGMWTLPGGGIDFGERPAEAVVREILEETGLTVRVDELLDGDAELLHSVADDGTPVHGHPVRFLYRVTVTGGTLGTLEVDGSTDEARWWPLDALPELTPVADRVLRTGRLNG